MKVIFSRQAAIDFDLIAVYLATHYPEVAKNFGRRLKSVLDQIGQWPLSYRKLLNQPDVHAAPLGKYPYILFYRVGPDAIEVLRIYHSSRQALWE